MKPASQDRLAAGSVSFKNSAILLIAVNIIGVLFVNARNMVISIIISPIAVGAINHVLGLAENPLIDGIRG
ncbi:hypothetical protein DUT91_24630 [Phyllobacterium salinisoli]|uniref:Uncharacterized protein n=1 Tax=Phyllobacterium salinisoli TaxID=1899321 RepID=A0A368JW22_9HYPH|nr:hypothetical protein DUT91_24630 [Phyllobacterium salinisoli]